MMTTGLIFHSEFIRKGMRFLRRRYALAETLCRKILYGHNWTHVICPICGWKGDHFIDFDCGYGVTYRHAECPQCHSHHRHRLLHFYLQRLHLEKRRRVRFLHFSPEKSVQRTLKTYTNLSYISADIEPGKAMKQENIESLSFDDMSFDIILCFSILEHVRDDRKAIRELYRILHSKGICIIVVPIDTTRPHTFQLPSIASPKDRAKAYWQSDHVRLYGNDFPNLLAAEGFTVTPFYGQSIAKQGDMITFGLPDLPIYICTKTVHEKNH